MTLWSNIIVKQITTLILIIPILVNMNDKKNEKLLNLV